MGPKNFFIIKKKMKVNLKPGEPYEVRHQGSFKPCVWLHEIHRDGRNEHGKVLMQLTDGSDEIAEVALFDEESWAECAPIREAVVDPNAAADDAPEDGKVDVGADQGADQGASRKLFNLSPADVIELPEPNAPRAGLVKNLRVRHSNNRLN